MRCPICGKEVELLRKQIGIDEMGEPVFNEYAVCRDCRKQWNLDKQRAKKQAEVSAGQSEKKETVKEKKAECEEVKVQEQTKKMQETVIFSKVVEKQDEVFDKKEEKSAAAKPTEEKQEVSEEKSKPKRKPECENPKAKKRVTEEGKISEEKQEASEEKDAPKRRPEGERRRPKKRVTEEGKISEEKQEVSKDKGEPKRRPEGERRRPPKRVTEENTISEEEKARRPRKKSTDVSDKDVARSSSKRAPDDRKKPAEKREGREGRERSENSRPRRRRPDEEPRYSNLPPEQVRVKKEKAVRQAYREMQVLDEEYGGRRKKRAEMEGNRYADKKRMDSQTNNQVRLEEKEEKSPFGLMRIFMAVVSLAAFGYFAYHGVMGMLNNISMASDSKVGLTSVIFAGCMLISAILLLAMRKKHTIFAFLLPMAVYIGGAVYTFLNRESDKMLLYGVIAAAAFGILMLILGVVSRIGKDEDDYED